MLEIDYKYIHELFSLKSTDFELIYKSKDYHYLHELFDNKYNISNYSFSFEMSCSNLINRLFEKYVTPKTIVICSLKDHPSVRRCLNNFDFREVIYLDNDDFTTRKLIDRLSISDYKNIFFLSCGTFVCNGEVRDNAFFEKIFHICEHFSDDVVKVLDDCQGSLWIDRDYSLFDYILWTAHATMEGFDAGVLISKPNKPVLGIYNVGEEFLYHNYSKLLEMEDFCTSWNKYLTLATNVHISNAPHLFNMHLTKNFPESYFKNLQLNRRNISQVAAILIDANRYVRLRVDRYITKEGKYRLLRALHLIYDEREFIDA